MKEKVIYLVYELGTYGDLDTLDYSFETEELAQKYINDIVKRHPSLTYKIEPITYYYSEESNVSCEK